MALAPVFARLSHQGVKAVGVAVSGGGDSMALLHSALRLAPGAGLRLEAATVDHALRAGSGPEAEAVGRFCAAGGIAHQVLVWAHDGAIGNLQADARAARYRLLAGWAQARDLGAVLLGHNQDDLAETFLIRLGRASGVDGLAAMAADFHRDGARFLRPLLGQSRAALRDYLRSAGIAWVEDPSNDNPRFTRVRMRRLLSELDQAGISVAAIAHSAAALADMRAWSDDFLHQEWQNRVSLQAGDLCIAGLPGAAEPARRLMTAALREVGGRGWPLRHAALSRLLTGLADQPRHSLGGCLITREKGGVLRISRELQAVSALTCPQSGLWDGRWQITGPAVAGAEIRALGAGIALCPDWRAGGLPRASVMAGPALWQGAGLIAAPLAAKAGNWDARLREDYGTSPFVH